MSRIQPIAPETATGQAKELLGAVKAKMGRAPNLTRGLAHSPAALNAYLQFSGALSAGVLPATVREQIALAVAQTNSCDYCLSAHSAIGKMAGLTGDQILEARRAASEDLATGAILRFTARLVEDRGHVTDADLETLRQAGISDAQITEIVANVALNIFTNYFNHVAETEIDFPKAEVLTV